MAVVADIGGVAERSEEVFDVIALL